MAYNDRPEFGDVAAVIQSELGELGVDVKIKGGDYAALEPDMLSGNFDAALLSRGYLVDVADPGGYLLSDWTCDGGYNIAHYCDPETDQMIQDAAAIEDHDERNAAYQEIAAKLQERGGQRLPPPREAPMWGIQADVEGFRAPPARPVRPHRRPQPRLSTARSRRGIT